MVKPGPVAVIFHRLGPYHWARLDAAGKRMDLIVIEEAVESEEYAWDRIEGDASFQRVTLFISGEDGACQRREMRRRVWAALEQARPSVIAVPGWTDRAALAAILWATQPGERQTPIVMMSDSTLLDAPRVFWKEGIKRQIVALCDAGLVGGKRHTEYLANLGLPVERIFTGYGVVDNAYFAAGAEAARHDSVSARKRLGLPERYFLACNRFVEKKNLPRLLDAYADYVRATGRSAWDLVMLGDGPLRSSLVAQAAALGVASRIHWPGFQQYAALPVYYGLAGAFVHVSTSEQWGLVVNEAMAAGLPVAVSDRCGCVPDLLVEGYNGFALDPLDVEGISRCLARLSGNLEELRSRGEASREIIQMWSPDRFACGLRAAVEVANDDEPRLRRVNPWRRLLVRALLST